MILNLLNLGSLGFWMRLDWVSSYGKDLNAFEANFWVSHQLLLSVD